MSHGPERGKPYTGSVVTRDRVGRRLQCRMVSGAMRTVRFRDVFRGFSRRRIRIRDGGERRASNPKRMGELSQAAFLAKAQSLGFGLALPWGDSEKYDFIVWARPVGRLLRVQVKATGRLNCGGYDVQPVYSTRGEGKKSYTAADIDVLAAHVVIEGLGGLPGKEVWYLLPIGAFAGVKSLRFYPDLGSRRARWEEYREQWSVIESRGQKSGVRGQGSRGRGQ